MARPNPEWQGGTSASQAASPGQLVPNGPIRLSLGGAAGQIVLSLLVTGDTPGPCMPETLALIVALEREDVPEIALSLDLARALRSLLVRTAAPPEVEDDVSALITSLQLQMMSTSHG